MGTDDLEFKAFSDELDRLAKNAEEMPPDVAGIEAQIESGLVEPFFEALGYDVSNWRHVRKRYGTEKWGDEKVDYALLGSNGEPMTLVECKSLAKRTLDRGGWKQLRRYFNDTGAKVGILTNGQTYEIYLDADKDNVMDEDPFFTFVISDKDMLARRAVSWLTRRDDGSFDLDGFKRAVDTWRFTDEYKPKAMRIFEGWLTGDDDEIVSLLEKRLEAQEGSLRELAHGWLVEFVDSKRDKSTVCPPSPPPDGLVPLPEWGVSVKKDLPPDIIFPNGNTARIDKAFDVSVKTTGWLIDNDYLTSASLPIHTSNGTILVSGNQDDFEPHHRPKKVSNVLVNSNFGAPDHVENAQTIIEHAGLDQRDFKGKFS